MNQSELVAAISARSNIEEKYTTVIVKEIVDQLCNVLIDGGRAEIRGVGSFYTTDYAARNARNPKTNEILKLDSRRLPHFKLGKDLDERLQGLLKEDVVHLTKDLEE